MQDLPQCCKYCKYILQISFEDHLSDTSVRPSLNGYIIIIEKHKFVFETYFIVLINIDLHISFPRRIFMDGNCSLSLSLSCFLDRYLLSLNLKANGNIIRGCDGWDNRRMEGEMDIRRITSSSHRQHWRMNPERRGSVMDRWSEQGSNEGMAGDLQMLLFLTFNQNH